MGYCTEILRAPATPAFQGDVNLSKPAFDYCKTIPGHVRGWAGIQIEDTNVGHLILNWETYEAHHSIHGTKTHEELLASLKDVLAGKPNIFHSYLNRDIEPVLSSPTVSITHLVARNGLTEEAKDALQKFFKWVDEKQLNKSAYGEIVEHSGQYVLLIGWESVEDHFANAPGADIIQPMRAHWVPNIVHVKMTAQ